MNGGQAGGRARHALVVGGTGMLAGVVRGLVSAGARTAVVARDAGRVRQLAATTAESRRVTAVPADWAVPGALGRSLDAVLDTGPGPRVRFCTAVLWVHSPHRSAVHEALEHRLAPGALVVDVVGSSVTDPSCPSTAGHPPPSHVQTDPRRTYRRVVLGFADGPAGTRWLTHREICDGVLAALEADARDAVTVVGRVAPWSQRPS